MLARKFGAMDLLASLQGTVKKSSVMTPHMEQILITHIFPELQSPVLFLRAKACQVFSLYYDIPYLNPQAFVSGLEVRNLGRKKIEFFKKNKFFKSVF